MVGRNQSDHPRCAGTMLALAAIALSCAAMVPPAFAQTEVSSGYKLTDEMRARLLKRGDLTLRDATFVEALFAIRKVWGVNIVVDNSELKEQTVSCDFEDTELHEILDTLLSPRGFGYRLVGKSLVVMKHEQMGAIKPLFESATIPVLYADPKEVKEAVALYLSEKGQITVVDSAKRLFVVDYPDRIEQIMAKARELDEAARNVGYQGQSSLSAAERQAIQRGNAAANSAVPGNSVVPGNSGSAGTGNAAAGSSLAGSGFPGANNKAAFFDLKHTKAELVMPTLQPLLSPVGKLSVLPKDNRLVVVDVPERLVMMAQAIRELDVPRPQVRISALIYDASLEDIRRFGVNWSHTGYHGTNLNSAGVAQDTGMFSAVTAAIPAAGAANGAMTLASLGSTFDVTAVVQALATSKNSRLLADPAVTVYDNEQAKIDIVTEIPYQQLTQGANGSNIGTTAFREAGVSLAVTPQISDDQTITMLVNPRFSLLTGFTPTTQQPIIDRRETNTTVRIRNRETLVIGGLRQKNSINSRSGIPFLMDLHWPFGELFKQKDVTAKDSELVVFITPELLDCNYGGAPRQHDIYSTSMPALDCIAHPQVPLPPCDLEEWKLRCGCKCCKKGGHEGPCTAKKHHQQRQQVDGPVPSMIYETPDTLEVLPPADGMWDGPPPIPPRGTNVPQVPVTNGPNGQDTRSPRLKPAQVEMAGKKKQSTSTLVSMEPSPSKPTPVEVAGKATQSTSRLPSAEPNLPKPVVAIRTTRLPAIETEPPYMAERLTPRDIFRPLPPVEETKLR